MTELLKNLVRAAVCAALILSVAVLASAQRKPAKKKVAAGPKVTAIDIVGLKKAIKPNGKPLLINFWATWCDPCREEFPDIVKMSETYKGKVDFITISLDDLADIKTYVPKFLAEMKSTMPAYLLHTTDESAAIALVASDWSGSLPMTILLNADGSKAYTRMGKIKPATVTAEIDKLFTATVPIATPTQ